MRRRARVDTHHAEITAALRAIGITVIDTSRVGDGFPDLMTYSRGIWLPIEVKTHRPRKRLTGPNGRRLTPAQGDLYRVAPFPIVFSVGEALALFGVIDA
jgi:hypothetical protein